MTQPPPSPTAAPSSDTSTDSSSPSPSTPQFPITLLQPSHHRKRSTKLLRSFRSAFRSFPILTPFSTTCHRFHLTSLHRGSSSSSNHIPGASRTTGTLFGHRKARITLSIQDNPRSVPILVLELAIATAKFMTDMGSSGLLRVALECEKKASAGAGGKTRLLDEPVWSAFINGRSVGYGTRRDPTDADLQVMKLLHAVSMGAGVLPGDLTDPADGELAYMRAHFDRVVGSKDSETFYMLNPDGNSGPELSIFFVRI